MPRARSLAFVLVLSTLPLSGVAGAQPAAVVQGRVTGEGGAGVPYAGVYLAGTTAGAATDSSGRFRFATGATGVHELRARAVGYAAATRRITLAPGDTLTMALVLREAVTALAEAVVTARAGGGPPALDEAAALRPLEAVTTAGASGDFFRALKLLPGAQATGDGSALFVRGGDKGETRVLLDGAPVTHPYRQETPTGGAFGTLPPFLVRGAHFSSGGFSARYGGALSGVLAMESEGRPQETSGAAGLGLAAVSFRAGAPLSGRLGARVSANRSFTGALFRVNGQADDFPTPPRAADASANLTYRYGERGDDSASGHVKLFGFAQQNRLGVEEHAPSYTGTFRNASTNQLYLANWTHRAGPWRAQATLSTDRHAAEQTFGALRLRQEDRAVRLRVDAARAWGEHVTLGAGAETARRTSTFRGRVPTAPGLQPPGAETTTLADDQSAWRRGAYAEARARLTDRLSLRAGLRTDHHTRAQRATLAPRLQLRYRLAEGTRARLAWGRYHQFPDPQQFAQAATLRAERAQHFIAGLWHERGAWTARLEAYYKPYDDLVVRTPAGTYANAGDGYAYGLDAFAKYGAFLQTRFSGWAAYSFLRSHRTQRRQLGSEYVLEQGPAPYDATHSLTLVGKMQVVGGLYAGGTFRWGTGRPVTPVVTSVLAGGGDRFLPVEGAVGSERRPAFRRLDLQLSYYRPFDKGERAATFYVSLANVLARKNVNGYDYDADYSERTPVFSPYRRLFYAGVTVDF